MFAASSRNRVPALSSTPAGPTAGARPTRGAAQRGWGRDSGARACSRQALRGPSRTDDAFASRRMGARRLLAAFARVPRVTAGAGAEMAGTIRRREDPDGGARDSARRPGLLLAVYRESVVGSRRCQVDSRSVGREPDRFDGQAQPVEHLVFRTYCKHCSHASGRTSSCSCQYGPHWQEHYADGEEASPQLYTGMTAEDRRLRLRGYEVYRLGGLEPSQP